MVTEFDKIVKRKQKFLYKTMFFLNCDCSDGPSVNGIRETTVFSCVSEKPPMFETFVCQKQRKLKKRPNKCGLNS